MVEDREFIDVAAKGLKIEKRPFKELAERFGMTELEAAETIGRLVEEGKVRRFAASVRHQPAGYVHNAMVIAKAEEGRVDEVGRAAREFETVSHCYHRDHPDGYPDAVYIMVHGRDEDQIQETAKRVENMEAVLSIEVCHSTRELKKTSVSGVTTNLADYED